MTPDFLDPRWMMIGVICTIRPLIAIAMIPVFAPARVPGGARNAFVLSLVAPVAWMHFQAGSAFLDGSGSGLLLLLLREAALGLLIGLGFAAFFAGLQAVGEIIDQQTGLTFSQNVDPINGNQVSVTAQLLEQLLFTALIAGGALLVIVQTIYLSFELFPIGRPLAQQGANVPLQLIEGSGRLFAFALLLAGPVMFVLLVAEIGFGLLNRAAPQLNVYNLTLTIKAMLGLAVLALALPMIIERVLLGFVDLSKLLQALLRG